MQRPAPHGHRRTRTTPEPDYERVVLHTPLNFTDDAGTTATLDQPDMNTSVRAKSSRRARRSRPRRPSTVGNWTGTGDTSSVFLGTGHRAPYMWGWGHPSNLAVQFDGSSGGTVLTAPHLKYTVGTAASSTSATAVSLAPAVHGKAYVKPDRWGSSLRDPTKIDAVVPKAKEASSCCARWPSPTSTPARRWWTCRASSPPPRQRRRPPASATSSK